MSNARLSAANTNEPNPFEAWRSRIETELAPEKRVSKAIAGDDSLRSVRHFLGAIGMVRIGSAVL